MFIVIDVKTAGIRTSDSIAGSNLTLSIKNEFVRIACSFQYRGHHRIICARLRRDLRLGGNHGCPNYGFFEIAICNPNMALSVILSGSYKIYKPIKKDLEQA